MTNAVETQTVASGRSLRLVAIGLVVLLPLIAWAFGGVIGYRDRKSVV